MAQVSRFPDTDHFGADSDIQDAAEPFRIHSIDKANSFVSGLQEVIVLPESEDNTVAFSKRCTKRKTKTM